MLAEAMCNAADMLCNLAIGFQSSSGWQALIASPGLIDAALTQLAGLAKYLHKQHLANQLTSNASGALAKKGNRGSPAALVVGTPTFAELLPPPYHDNIAVAGGKQAIAAQAEAVE
jgi:hypothetical protein